MISTRAKYRASRARRTGHRDRGSRCSARPLPCDPALDGDPELREARLPSRNIGGVDGKRKMYGATSIVRGNQPAGGMRRLHRLAFLKQEQHCRRACVESDQPFTGHHRHRAQQSLVEPGRSPKIVAIQGRLENFLNPHRHRMSSTGGGTNVSWSGSDPAPHGGVARVASDPCALCVPSAPLGNSSVRARGPRKNLSSMA
jgi:hypothetical protein